MDDDSGTPMDGVPATGMPASVAAAWGLTTRPAKGPKPGLSLDRIVASAVRIAGADGLAAVSMNKVAAEVGVTAMALYRYVGNKNELLALMVDAGLGLPPEVPAPGQGWREGLSEWAWAMAAAYRREPWAMRVPIGGAPALPNQSAWMDRGLRCLSAVGGLGEEDKLSTILLLSNLVRVYATIEADLAAVVGATEEPRLPEQQGHPGKQSRSGQQDSLDRHDRAMAAYSQMMSLLADPVRFPALATAIRSGALAKADPLDQELRFGLERALDGIAVLIEREAT